MTVLDALRSRVNQPDLQRASDALIAALPVGHSVEITPDVIAAAVAGDVPQLLMLFAEQLERNELDREPSDPGPLSAEELRRAFGLS
jgi:hypothetical protein